MDPLYTQYREELYWYDRLCLQCKSRHTTVSGFSEALQTNASPDTRLGVITQLKASGNVRRLWNADIKACR